MKAFLLLLVLVLAGVGVYRFYLKDHPVTWLQGPETTGAGKNGSPPAAKKDFKDLSTLLQGDMDRIPHDLREARQMPNHAFDVKARVAPHLQEHEEYRTLTQVCDTIIGADQDFGERQSRCGLGKTGPGNDAYKQQETLWEGRRRQADSDVRARLATLENRRL